MKKFISLLVCVMLLCSVSITSFAASTTGIPFTLVPSKTNVEAGETFTITIKSVSTEDALLMSLNYYIDYDNTLVERDTSADVKNTIEGVSVLLNEKDGSVLCCEDNVYGSEFDTALVLGFKVKEGVETGNAAFNFRVAEDKKIAIGWDYTEYAYNSDFDVTNCSVTIGGSTPDPEPVFTVDKAVVDGAVKVTVANAEELSVTGSIYVATFNEGVLVDCIEKPIVDGTIDFTGLKGNVDTAQMFVWNDQLVPITYTTSAQ